jgi:hypothetical protein
MYDILSPTISALLAADMIHKQATRIKNKTKVFDP